MSQNVNINLVPGNYPKEFHVSQYDVGRQLVAKVVDSTGDYSIPAGATVVLVGTKPSGFGFTLNGTVSGSTVTFSTTATVTAEYGRIPCELRITSGDTVLGTANLMLIVEESPHQEGVIDGNSETVIPELTILVERVEAAASNVLDMQVEADTLPAGSSATYSYNEETNTATFGIPQGEAGAGTAGVVASAYSASSTYAVGDYVIHDGNLYRCTTAITTAEAFTAAHWTQVVLGDDVSNLKSEINQIDDSIMGDALVISSANSLSSWESGDIDSSTGANSSWSKATRMKIANAIYAKNDMVLKSTGTGAYIYVYQYNDSTCTDFEKQFTKYLNYQGTTELELPKGYYYRLKSYFTDLRVITSSDMETLMGMFVLTEKTQIQKNEELASEAYKLTSAFNYDDVFTDVDGLSWTSDKYVADYGAPTILSANDYAYTSISVKAGEKYSIKGWSYFGQKVALYFIGTTMTTAYPTTSDNPAKYHEFIIDIPTDGTLYINKNYAHTTSEMTIAKATDTSVADIKKTHTPNTIAGKEWYVIGDSLSDEDADSDTVYWTYIAEDNGMAGTQLAHSGCGFLQGSDPFSTQANSVTSDAEIVTVFGSWNDLNMALGMMTAYNNLGALGDDGDENLTYTYTDGSGVSQTATNAPSLYGAVRKTIDTILTKSPYAKIGFILPTPWGTRCWFNATNWVRTVMDAYLKAIVDTCAIYSIPVLDLYHNGQMKPWNATFQAKYYKTSDTTHPNSLGHKEFIAPAVEAWMKSAVN